jgi:hypothetical protein
MMDELMISLHTIGELANLHAARSAFTDYQEKCAANTRARQHGDLALFCLYLSEVSIQNTPERLLSDPESCGESVPAQGRAQRRPGPRC